MKLCLFGACKEEQSPVEGRVAALKGCPTQVNEEGTFPGLLPRKGFFKFAARPFAPGEREREFPEREIEF